MNNTSSPSNDEYPAEESPRTDRRIRKTRNALRASLLKLLKRKRLQDISVREISEAADINRATFYLHYKDVYDLMSHVENDFAQEFDGILSHYEMDGLMHQPYDFFAELYPFVKKNALLLSTLLGEQGNLHFLHHAKQIIRSRILSSWLEAHATRESPFMEAYLSYIVSGCIGLIQYWIENGFQESAREMSQLTVRFITSGIPDLASMKTGS